MRQEGIHVSWERRYTSEKILQRILSIASNEYSSVRIFNSILPFRKNFRFIFHLQKKYLQKRILAISSPSLNP